MRSSIVRDVPARRAVVLSVTLVLAAACGSDSVVVPPPALSLGQSHALSGPQTITLEGGATGADYYAVIANTSEITGALERYTIAATGVVTPTTALLPTGGAALDLVPAAGRRAPTLDRAFEARLRERERQSLTPLFGTARRWLAARTARSSASAPSSTRAVPPARRDGALPANVKVGDIVTVNVNGDDPCDNPVYHGARVKAIGTHSIMLADTLNPAGGFSDADFQRFAARFDTLVYPIDSAAFGPPTDVDNNARVGLIVTRAVNELTARNADSFVGGFTFSRDLFPVTATQLLPACAGSNQGEFFYLLAPDPTGSINGNVRTTGFVDTNTTAIIAHEFQHLINAGRRIFVNDANDFEETWLDEGLAHIAEELLFYHEAGVGPRNNLDTPLIRATERRRTAFNLDMLGNAGRYADYLEAPSSSSPYADDDELSTRGAAWSLLRYLADRSGRTDNAFFFGLVNSADRGLGNLKVVYGSDLPAAVRDWNVSHAADDVVATAAELQQPSWDWHSLYATLSNEYPLDVATLTGGPSISASVVAGGAAYYRFGVAAGSSATLTVTDASSTAPASLRIVVVRTR